MAQFPLFQKFQKAIQHPPALSLGLPIFLTVIFLLSQRYVWIEDDLELRSTALTNFEREYTEWRDTETETSFCFCSHFY